MITYWATQLFIILRTGLNSFDIFNVSSIEFSFILPRSFVFMPITQDSPILLHSLEYTQISNAIMTLNLFLQQVFLLHGTPIPSLPPLLRYTHFQPNPIIKPPDNLISFTYTT